MRRDIPGTRGFWRRDRAESGASTVLLLGFDPRTGLAVARSLHRRSIRVIVATLADWETPISSRAVAEYFPLPRLGGRPADFVRALVRLIDTQDVDTLIPLTDRALVALAPHHDELRKKVRLLAPTPEQTALILDKSETARLATALGIPVPTTVLVEEGQELHELEGSVRFPVFLKPQSKALSCLSQSAPGPEVFACADLAALRARLCASGAGGGRFLVQEKVPGDDVGLAIVMHCGEPVSTFQYRARRMWPADGGVCVAARSEQLHTGMAVCALRLLRALKWEGVAELDFRHDRATDRFALLEVNGRFWGSTAAAVVAGADMPWTVWQLAHHQLGQPARYRSDRSVRWLEGDLRRLADLARHNPAPGRWARVARELVAFFWDFRPTVSGMFWSWRDPAPAFHSTRILAQWWCVARARDLWRKIQGPCVATPRAKAHRPALSP